MQVAPVNLLTTAFLWFSASLLFYHVGLAQELSVENLHDLKVTAKATVIERGRHQGRNYTVNTQHEWNLSFGPGNAVNGFRYSIYRHPGRPDHKAFIPIRGSFGYPAAHQRGGHYVWIVHENSIVHLFTTDVGAFKTVFVLQKNEASWGCRVETGIAKEVGKGPNRTPSIVTGKTVEILGVKQISSSCAVTSAVK